MAVVRPLWRVPGIIARERLHPSGRQRIPEPMVMDDLDAVAHFHSGGATNPGMRAVYDFCARSLDALLPTGGRLLDLGVGSGRALSAVLHRRADVSATAVDLAPNMLATARELFVAEGLDRRVDLIQADITALPAELASQPWDGISCMWTLHQLPDFGLLRAALRQIAELRRGSGAALWISDFQRLRDPSACPAMLGCVDPSSPERLRQDAIASEAAAFTRAELGAALADAGLGGMHSGHSRPLPYLQVYWMAGRHDTGRAVPRDAAGVRLRGSARREAALLRSGFTAKPF
jgi:SAM-dependent methyltransferase